MRCIFDLSRKSRNLNIVSSARGKDVVGQTKLFNLGLATGLANGKLNSN